MDQFTARNALLTGVALIRRRPYLVLTWAAVFLARAIILAVAYQGLMGWAAARGASGAPIMGLQLTAGAFAVGKTAVSLVLAAVLLASAFRAFLRPQATAPFGFGGQELRVLASHVITQFMAALPVLAVFCAIVLVHGLGGVISGNRWIVTVCEILGLFWSYLASVWAFDRLEIAPFRCWAIARGRFWLLAGLVLGVLVLRLFVNAGVDRAAAALSQIWPAAPAPENVFVTAPRLSDAFQAPALFQDLAFAAIEALEIAILAGIVSMAYGARLPEPQAATFSSVASGPAS